MVLRLFLILCFLANAGMALATHTTNKTLIVGSEEDFPPFAVGKTDQTASGYTVDLWKEVAKESGLKYSIRVRPWGQILQEFKDGKIDVLINIAQSEERGRYTDFSMPHATVHGAVFVRKDDSRIRSEADLAGKSVIVFKSDLAHEYAVSKGWQNRLVIVNTPQEGLKLLASGQHDAMLLSKLAGMQTIRELDIKGIQPIDAAAGYSQKFSFGVHKGEAELLAHLNEGLAMTKADGDYDAIYDKWFGIYEEKKLTLRDMLPYIAPILIIPLLIGSYNFRRRRIERKKSEEALRESEERFKNMFRSHSAVMLLIDPESGGIADANQAAEAFYGYSRDALLGMNISDINTLPPETISMELGNILAKRKDVLIFPHRIASGEIRTVEVHSSSIRQQDITLVFSIIHDITERKRSEAYRRMGQDILHVLNEKESQSDAIQRVIRLVKDATGVDAVGIRLQDQDDYPYYCQEGFLQEFLQKENSILSRNQDGGLCRDECGNVCLECTCGLVITGKTDPSSPLFTKGGSSWTNNSFPVLDLSTDQDPRSNPRNECIHQGFASIALIPIRAKGSIVGLLQLNDHRTDCFTLEGIEALEDVAENIGEAMLRKQAEEKLVASERFLRMLTDQLPGMVGYWTDELRCSFANKAYLEWFGKAPEQMVGITIQELMGEELFRRNEPYIRGALRGEPQQFERTLVKPTGEIGFTWAHYIPDVVDGKVRGFIVLVSDVTELKQSEEERVKLEAQLHQAQKLESVGSLAGGVAHDFNNKLSVILGHVYLALSESIPDDVQSSLEEIRKAAEQSADLTRQLLAFARKQTIAPRVLNLNETVSGMLKMLQRLIGEDIHLSWQPAPELWLLKLDPSQIDQILANLCVNARDAISDGGAITIESGNCVIDDDYCRHHADVVPGEYVRLVVSDNGCGMSRETLGRIFEPFFTTKEQGRGTGLGLATIFGIVKQNNGFINVYSEPGVGTTFTIYLPRYLGASEQIQRESLAPPAPRGLETILLVEDELAILNMATMILTRQGYTVLQANSPEEALRIADEHAGQVSLLVTDVIMPEMNGKDLANRLKSRSPQLRCLFMSGYTADAIAQHGVLDEGVNFIQKPFSLPGLATKVREVLDGGHESE